jgi:agmatine deiminase
MTTLVQPPEWAPHAAVWIGFPSHGALWLEDLEPARAEVVAFARAVHAGGKGERVILVAADDEAGAAATALAGDCAEVVVEPFGDIWLRSWSATAARVIFASTAGAANTICPVTTMSGCGWRRGAR